MEECAELHAEAVDVSNAVVDWDSEISNHIVL